MLKKAFFAALCATAILCTLTACSPELTVQADSKNGISLAFKAGFSPAAADTLRSFVVAVSGSVDDAMPVIPASDISTVLTDCGFSDIAAKNPTPTDIAATAVYRSLSEGALPATGLLTRTKNSLTLTLGPRQLGMLYMLSSEDARLYFDLLMIPVLDESAEATTVTDYTELLASLYGKQFAEDLTAGTLKITLTSPDGKKKTTAAVSLGETLTSTREQSWTVSW